MRDFQMRLRNLTNVQDVEEPAFAEIDVRGGMMGNAPVSLTGRIDPNETTPTFDVDFSLEGARLVDVNPWLREFLKVDAEMGVFSMYAELAAAEGRFEGYARPILEDPKFVDKNEDDEGPAALRDLRDPGLRRPSRRRAGAGSRGVALERPVAVQRTARAGVWLHRRRWQSAGCVALSRRSAGPREVRGRDRLQIVNQSSRDDTQVLILRGGVSRRRRRALGGA